MKICTTQNTDTENPTTLLDLADVQAEAGTQQIAAALSLHWDAARCQKILGAEEQIHCRIQSPIVARFQFVRTESWWTVPYEIHAEVAAPCVACLRPLELSLNAEGVLHVMVDRGTHEQEHQLRESELDFLLVEEEVIWAEDLLSEAFEENVPTYPRCEHFGLTCHPLLEDLHEANAETTGSLASAFSKAGITGS